MKPTKQKHGKENLIGKIIYAFLMFIPLIAIGVTCAYAIFNKNAYQSYSAEQSLNYELVNTNTINEDTIYYFKSDNNLNTQLTQPYIKITSISSISGVINVPQNPNRFRIYYNPNNTTYSLQIDGTTTTYTTIGNTTNINVYQFSFIANEDLTENPYSNNILMYDFSEQQTLDNVFYYSIDKVQESPLFNWSSNTATYSVLQQTCTTLEITPQFIPMLLSYWLMMSLMYLLYDMALLIVHMAHNRIHDIESSI